MKFFISPKEEGFRIPPLPEISFLEFQFRKENTGIEGVVIKKWN
jgi:hypothetical protein